MKLQPYIDKEITLKDLEKITDIEKQVFKYYLNFWEINHFQEVLSKKDLYIFQSLKLDNNIIGYIVLMKVDSFIELHKIAIVPDYQGQGYGFYLLKNIIDNLRLIDIENIVLEVNINNINAIKLYEKLGFNVIGVRKNYYKMKDDNSNIFMQDALVLGIDF